MTSNEPPSRRALRRRVRPAGARKTPSIKIAQKLARALGVPVTELLE